MSFKQWNAAIMLAVEAVIAAWLVYDAMIAETLSLPVSAVAAKLLWVGLVMIVLNILAAIGTAIVGSIVTRKEFKDERSDERDKAVYARSMRNAYFVGSLGGLAALFLLAFGFEPAFAAYAVFVGGMLAGAAGAMSQLIYYGIG